MKIHYLQHIPFENPGSILTWARENNYTISGTHLYKNESLPKQEEFDWLIVMGGPMNIYEEDQYPWLIDEKRFIKQAIDHKKLIIGLCLGGQLIADVLGGTVIKNNFQEIGWLPITFYEDALAYPQFSFLPKKPIVFEWHGDTFTKLPLGTVMLASNEACANQAFLYGSRVYGFQFHMESTLSIIEDLIHNCGDEMIPGTYVQSADYILSQKEYIKRNNHWMNSFLSELAFQYEKEEL